MSLLPGQRLQRLHVLLAQRLPGTAVLLGQGAHPGRVDAVEQAGDGGDVVVDADLAGGARGVLLAERAKDPQLLDFARERDELLDRRVLFF